MPTLSVVDAAMFGFESKDRPFGIGPLILLKPAEGQARGFADRLVARMLKRPVGAPFDYVLRTGLGLPSVESVPGVKAADHVQRIRLKGKATQAALFERVCELGVELLDRSRPLWQLYVIDGLEDGRVALYGKVHHGVLDGRGFVHVLEHWLSSDPTDTQVHALWDGIPQPQAPARGPLADRLLDGWDRTGALVDGARGLLRLLSRRSVATLGLASGLPLPFVGVPNVLDGPLNQRRSFACCMLPLRELKALGKAHGATVNDVFLTVLDVALDRYLREQQVERSGPLVVDMPVALGGAGGSNQIAMLQLGLGLPDAEPAERFERIRDNTASLKRETARQRADSMMLYTALSHLYPSLIERVGLGRPIKLANMVVSNPFGLSRPRYLMGAAVEMVLPFSLVAPGQTLNITGVTLDEKFQVGFLALPEAVPEVERLAALTVEALARLQEALAPKQAPVPTPAPARRRKAATRDRAAPIPS